MGALQRWTILTNTSDGLLPPPRPPPPPDSLQEGLMPVAQTKSISLTREPVKHAVPGSVSICPDAFVHIQVWDALVLIIRKSRILPYRALLTFSTASGLSPVAGWHQKPCRGSLHLAVSQDCTVGCQLLEFSLPRCGVWRENGRSERWGSGEGGRGAGLSCGKCHDMTVDREGGWGATHSRVTPAGDS